MHRRFGFWPDWPRVLLTIAALAISLISVRAQTTIFWRNTGTQFSTGTNWVGLTAPTNSLTANVGAFTNTTVTANPDVTADRSISGLVFGAGTGAWTFSGGAGDTLSLGSSGIVNNSTSTQTFNPGAGFNLALGAGTSFAANSGAIVVAAPVDLNTFTLTLGGSNANSTISGVISDSGSVVKTGPGTWTLSGANTYSGTTSIGTSGGPSGGTLSLGANNVLPGTTVNVFAGTLDVNTRTDTIGALNLGGGAAGTTAQVAIGTGGVLTLGDTVTYDAANNPNGATISGTGTLALGGATRTFTVGDSTAAAADLTVATAVSGAVGLTKGGAGVLVLSGANTYTGTTTVSTGVLNIQNNTALGTTAGGTTVASGAALEVQNNITVTGEGLTISGTGVGGNGALRNISGTNTWTGTTTLAAAAEVQSDAGRLIISGTVTNSTPSTLTVDGAGDTTISGSVGLGSGGITKNGAGSLVLSASNSYTGSTAVNAGVLNIQNSRALGATNSGTTVASGAALELQGNISVTNEALALSGTGIGNNGALRNLSGSNTWTGPTTLATNSEIQTDAGRLTVSGSVTSSNRSLTVDGSGNTTLSGPIALGAGNLTKTGSGTLTISGSNSSSGLLSILGGKLEVGSSNNLGTGAISIDGGVLRSTNTMAITPSTRTLNIGTNGGTVEVVSGTTLTYEGIMLGSGKLTKTGTGTFQTGQLTNWNVAAAIGGVANAGLGIASFFNFDQLAVGTTNTTVTVTNSFGTSNSMNVTFTGDAGVRTGNNPGQWAAPFLSGENGAGFGTNGSVQPNGVDITPYLATGSSTNGTITFTLSQPLEYFGILWGSVDGGTNNSLTFRDATNGVLFRVTGGDVLNSPNGDQGTNGTVYANINSDRPVYSIVATAPSPSFEFDNIAIAEQTLRTGPLDILEGTFQVINAGFFNGIGTNSPVFVAGGATFSFRGNTNLSQQTIGPLSGSGTVINEGARAVDFRVNSTSNSTFAGTITDTTNNLNLVKLGPGTLTLTGSNTYDGTTRVTAGTLVLSNTSGQSLANTTSIQVDSGATLALGADNQIGNSTSLILNGGTFRVGTDTAGYSDTLGTLTLTASSTIDLGSFTGAHTLTFANSSAIAWATNAVLTISNWQGVTRDPGDAGRILFGPGGLTSAQLAQVYWAPQNISGGVLINSNGELVPIPEPRVYAAAVALLAVVAWRERKRWRALLRRS